MLICSVAESGIKHAGNSRRFFIILMKARREFLPAFHRLMKARRELPPPFYRLMKACRKFLSSFHRLMKDRPELLPPFYRLISIYLLKKLTDNGRVRNQIGEFFLSSQVKTQQERLFRHLGDGGDKRLRQIFFSDGDVFAFPLSEYVARADDSPRVLRMTGKDELDGRQIVEDKPLTHDPTQRWVGEVFINHQQVVTEIQERFVRTLYMERPAAYVINHRLRRA